MEAKAEGDLSIIWDFFLDWNCFLIYRGLWINEKRVLDAHETEYAGTHKKEKYEKCKLIEKSDFPSLSAFMEWNRNEKKN